ncbi:hypothetical protein VC83_04421 [Pseudogymnoascus destructans]|uniref:DNA polymerase delta subunit 4 n=1 Tax=Pseudogymnoascus destructans TaxID=655981 RepID=A0A177ABC3_9PEZI|nr:uncharacterized protein VC83_04421 [Pseudogymnoascus destructans]OAF59426.1 hypothetical protein VC83_04421 [Pseudogymnoascus destructans]
MPATTRRTRGAPPAKGAQSTLSFNGAATRVTKHTGPAGKDLKKAEPAKPAKVDVIDLDRADDAVVEAEVQTPPQVQLPKPESALTPEEEKAEKVPHSQVLRYWKAKEAERLAPRVHQEGLSTEEKILRYFDMSSQYGPCVGIPRRKRWLRAHRLGLAPPIETLAVLVKEDKKGKGGVEKAQLESLLETIGGDL